MNFMLTLFCLCAAVCYCYGACFVIPPESKITGLNSVYQPCYYDGELIPRGTSVTRNCLNCYCGANRVVSCCSVGTKVSRLPDGCKKIVSEDGCYEHAVKISDNRNLCTYGVGMVGR